MSSFEEMYDDASKLISRLEGDASNAESWIDEADSNTRKASDHLDVIFEHLESSDEINRGHVAADVSDANGMVFDAIGNVDSAKDAVTDIQSRLSELEAKIDQMWVLINVSPK